MGKTVTSRQQSGSASEASATLGNQQGKWPSRSRGMVWGLDVGSAGDLQLLMLQQQQGILYQGRRQCCEAGSSRVREATELGG
jgi:hypothetical protein